MGKIRLWATSNTVSVIGCSNVTEAFADPSCPRAERLLHALETHRCKAKNGTTKCAPRPKLSDPSVKMQAHGPPLLSPGFSGTHLNEKIIEIWKSKRAVTYVFFTKTNSEVH
jgi:hypothetical protein